MGILNLTPDSFSDGGRYTDIDTALYRVEEMLKQGMDILDIGGESTRPGYTQISEAEEIDRVIPAISRIKSSFDVPVSLDTYKSEVAKAGLEAGVDIINDIWGLKYDEKLAKLIATASVPCIIMHNRKEEKSGFGYHNFITDVIDDLKDSLRIAENAGISDDKIILDPGVGFAKTYEQNLQIMAKLKRFHELGKPLLLGASRKSVIGLTLDLSREERVEGTLATTALAVECGCSFVRVHDIKENVRLIKMLEAVKAWDV